jgi:nucleoside-diphosphate-sugar epimerase
MEHILFTGFPGFLGSQLLHRLLTRHTEARAHCLIQPAFSSLAQCALQELGPEIGERVQLVEGDITRPGLGLSSLDWLASVDHTFHLAAIYDLDMSRSRALSINLEGTRNVVALLGECTNLRRLHYVSTCYVSGRHPGVFHEADLDVDQSFNNVYEETKFLAEGVVRAWGRDGGPVTIYRPASVVGDSDSGATQKYDGPYFVLKLILRQSKIAIVPVLGGGGARVNFVPRDFVTGAIEYLSARSDTLGSTFHLADPAPYTAHEVIDLMGRLTGRRIVRVRLPHRVADWATRKLPPVRRLTGIPAGALGYFTHPTLYSTAATEKALEGSGLRPPRFDEYLPRLVAFVRAHPEIGSYAMA